MKLLSKTFVIALATALTSAGGALAQGTMQPRGQNNIDYVSGGVGQEQQERVEALAAQGYTLKLVFAEQGTGAYLADVRVNVADASGHTLLDANADGPAFLARLPEGDYKVTVEHRGMRQTRIVHAASRSARAVFYWP